MKLKDALLCIDCDEVFAAEGLACNLQCPRCGSSVFARLDTWVQTWTAFEKLGSTSSMRTCEASPRKRRVEVVRPTPIAA